jgi:2-polyprenyl-6-methoxyphenol hydroxylase-like FAD-dependent oxidoreductase
MPVLIVGAGPVGLTLALALHRQGVLFRHVDRAAAPSVHSKALGIQARTLEAVARLGLAEPILASALRPVGMRFHLGGSVQRIDLTHRQHGRFPSMVLLPQAETERLLAATCRAVGIAPVERGVELLGLDAESGEATLRRADGREETARFDHIVGCDGAHSQVRKSAAIAFEGARYEEAFALADGEAEGLEPACMHAFPGHNGAGIFFPLPGGRWRAVAMMPAGTQVAEGDLSPFQHPGIRFRDPVWFSAFAISHRLAATYLQGRVLLAGDAAHIHSPAGGQGMNLGMQDACSLAQALPKGPAALAEWAAARRAVAAMVIRRTDAMTRLVLGQTAALRAVRAVGLRVMPRLPPARRRMERALAGLDYPQVS